MAMVAIPGERCRSMMILATLRQVAFLGANNAPDRLAFVHLGS
jgi:hypothetical protein